MSLEDVEKIMSETQDAIEYQQVNLSCRYDFVIVILING